MPYTTYILKSTTTKRLYIGQTNNLQDRLRRHNAGLVPATRRERPWVLVSHETHPMRSMAVQRERYLKSLKNPQYILKTICRGPVA
ncbi:MAG: GIY-YIG nuclease family protein [bacterium]|nr:GIY-YIG nuclease family protein [bacterium]